MIQWQATITFCSYGKMMTALGAIANSPYEINVISEDVIVKRYPQMGFEMTVWELHVEGSGEESFNLIAQYSRDRV